MHQGAYFLNSVADLKRDLGQLDEAEALYQESLESALVCQWLLLVSFNLMGQARIAIARGEWERAATLGGGEIKIRQGRDLGIEDDPDAAEQNYDYERTLYSAQEALGEEAFREAWARGASMTLGEIVAEAGRATREAAV